MLMHWGVLKSKAVGGTHLRETRATRRVDVSLGRRAFHEVTRCKFFPTTVATHLNLWREGWMQGFVPNTTALSLKHVALALRAQDTGELDAGVLFGRHVGRFLVGTVHHFHWVFQDDESLHQPQKSCATTRAEVHRRWKYVQIRNKIGDWTNCDCEEMKKKLEPLLSDIEVFSMNRGSSSRWRPRDAFVFGKIWVMKSEHDKLPRSAYENVDKGARGNRETPTLRSFTKPGSHDMERHETACPPSAVRGVCARRCGGEKILWIS